MSTQFLLTSEASLLLRFGTEISIGIHEKVANAFLAIESLKNPAIVNLHPAYASLLVEFDPLKISAKDLQVILQENLSKKKNSSPVASKPIEIPVSYGGIYGPDLDEVAKHHGISTDEVISLHTKTAYRVYFLGFQPGFGYLGTLPKELETPRLATPRLKVAAGSVGIAGLQTGVYPMNSSGGWRILGQTPLKMFDPTRSPASLLSVDSEVRFYSISPSEFEGMK